VDGTPGTSGGPNIAAIVDMMIGRKAFLGTPDKSLRARVKCKRRRVERENPFRIRVV
jgi:hypothetical protein